MDINSTGMINDSVSNMRGLEGTPDIWNHSYSYSAKELAILAFLIGYGRFPTALNTLLLFFFGLGAIANITLIVYIVKSKKYKIPIFTLFASLAFCDALTCFWAVVMARWLFPEPVATSAFGADLLCRASASSGSLAYKSSLLHLMFLSGVRFYQLTKPLAAQVKITAKWILAGCLTMWLISACLSAPFAVFFRIFSVLYNARMVTVCIFDADGTMRELMYVVFQLMIPTLAIAILHILKQWQLSKNPALTQQERRSTSSRVVTFLISLFILSILPRFLHASYHSFLGFPNKPIHISLVIFSVYFSYLNSVTNPFVYLLCSREIRHNMYLVFFKRASKNSNIT